MKQEYAAEHCAHNDLLYMRLALIEAVLRRICKTYMCVNQVETARCMKYVVEQLTCCVRACKSRVCMYSVSQ